MITEKIDRSHQVEIDEKEKPKTEIRSLNEISKSSVFIYKYIKIVVLVEIILILGIGYFFIIKPELSKMEQKKDLVLLKRNELIEIKNYKDDAERLEIKYQNLKQKISDGVEKLYNILPPEQNLPNIMAQVEALVNHHGLRLGKISISAKPGSDSKDKSVPFAIEDTDLDQEIIKEIQVEIFVFGKDGDYDKVKELLDALEHHIRLIDVTSFSFDETMKSYTIIFKTYYLINEE